MKVIDHLTNAKDTLFSFEILPPLKGKSIQSILNQSSLTLLIIVKNLFIKKGKMVC